MFGDSREPDILSALDLAFSHARRGNISESECIVNRLRSTLPIQEFPRAATQTIFVEGVIAAYRCDWSTARDKFNRSGSLSRAQGNRSVELLSMAWMAFVEFNLNNLSEAVRLSVEVLQDIGSIDAHTACRAALVLAASYQLVDNRASAERWFHFTKRTSEQVSETALTSVIIFDSAVIRIAVERFNRYFDVGASRDLDLELLFVRSAINFDSGGNVGILTPFHNLLHGQVLNLRGEYADAVAALDPIFEIDTVLSPMIRAQASLERVWSRSNLKDERVTAEELDREIRCLELLTDDDDQAVGCLMFSRMYERLGNELKARELDGKAIASSERVLEWRRSFSEELNIMAAGLKS